MFCRYFDSLIGFKPKNVKGLSNLVDVSLEKVSDFYPVKKLFFSQNRGQNNPILPTTTLPFLPGDARLMKTQKSCTSPLQIDANECVFGTAVL